MIKAKQLIVMLLASLITHHANSKQLHFSKTEEKDAYLFNYQWLDHQQQSHLLSFTLEKSVLFNQFRHFRSFKKQQAAQYINKSIFKALQRNPAKDTRISYNQNSTAIVVKGPAKQIKNTEQQIAKLKKKFTDEYLNHNFYHQFVTHNNVSAIKPNHVKFAQLSVNDLTLIKPVLLQQAPIQSARKTINYLLSFIQSIPYSTLDDRINSSGAGFNPPLKLLWENQGDCDSKVTLFASLLRSLIPKVSVALVFINNHALIGISIPARANEQTITVNGVTYLLADPTGPALLPAGRLGETSELAILQEQYTAEVVHKRGK